MYFQEHYLIKNLFLSMELIELLWNKFQHQVLYLMKIQRMSFYKKFLWCGLSFIFFFLFFFFFFFFFLFSFFFFFFFFCFCFSFIIQFTWPKYILLGHVHSIPMWLNWLDILLNQNILLSQKNMNLIYSLLFIIPLRIYLLYLQCNSQSNYFFS